VNDQSATGQATEQQKVVRGERWHACQHATVGGQCRSDEGFLTAVDDDAGPRVPPEVCGDVVGSVELLDLRAGVEDEARRHVPEAGPVAVAGRLIEVRHERSRTLSAAECFGGRGSHQDDEEAAAGRHGSQGPLPVAC
jgi:hypothetical protein